MSTADTTQVATYAKEIVGKDPQAALEIVIAHTEAVQAKAAADATEQQALSAVTFGDDGLQTGTLDGLWRLAKMYCRSRLLPDHFHGQQEDCLIGLQLAKRMGVDPFMLFQNLYVVHGKPGIEAKLAIALVNASGKIKGSVTYYLDGEGAQRFCRATVIEAETGREIEYTVPRKLATTMGWDKPGKGGMQSQWVTNPDLMLRYRAAMFLIRTHYPEVIMGLQSREELVDTFGVERQEMGADLAKRATRSKLNDKVGSPETTVTHAPVVKQPHFVEPKTPETPTGDPHPDVAADAAKNLGEQSPKPDPTGPPEVPGALTEYASDIHGAKSKTKVQGIHKELTEGRYGEEAKERDNLNAAADLRDWRIGQLAGPKQKTLIP